MPEVKELQRMTLEEFLSEPLFLMTMQHEIQHEK